MTTPLPAAAAAMTKDEAVRELLDFVNTAPGRLPERVQNAIASLTAPAGVPDGYVVVPREPTEAMKEATSGMMREWHPEDAGHIYRAMLAAAPPSDAPGECNCSLRTRLVGDGCEVCNPSPAEQGAREECVTWDDARKAIHSAYADGKSGNGYTQTLDWLHDRKLAPLAAGRVGVAVDEAMVTRACEGYGAAMATAGAMGNRYHYDWMRAALEAALAGPLVAGEVEAYRVSWPKLDMRLPWIDGDLSSDHERVIRESGGEVLRAYSRPLVYADTAKGASDGR